MCLDRTKTKDLVSNLTSRICSGDRVGAPSYYEPSHHSLPHTDQIGQRAVAYLCYSHSTPWWYLSDPNGLINSIGVLGLIETLGSDGENHFLEQGAAA